MIIFNKFCCCIPLRQGCLVIGYIIIISSFLEVYAMMFNPTFCEHLKKLWYLHDEINIISGILLLACSHNPEHLTFLLPVQIFVKLIALIIELTIYLLLASTDDLPTLGVIYSFISITETVYCLLVIFSFFQKLEKW